MRLFDFVEEHHGIGLAPHLLRELTALLVTDVARRRADEPRGRVLFHILRHVDAHDGALIAEERLRQRAAELRLAHARGTEKEEAANRTVRISEPDAAAPDRGGDGGHGLVLSHDAAAQRVLHVQQPLALVGGDRRHGDAGPERDDLRHILFGHGADMPARGLFPSGARLLGARSEHLRALLQRRGALKIPPLHRLLQLAETHVQPLLQRVQRLRQPQRLHPHARGGLVHQVDRLVRQKPVADIPHREPHRRVERLVRDRQPMVLLQPRAQRGEDPAAFVRVRLQNADRLEPSLQSSVFLNVQTIFLQRGGADDLHRAAPERGLEDVCRVDRALGRARADDRVQLVDEEDHVAHALHLAQHGLHEVFKVAAILRSCEHRREIERHDALLPQIVRHRALGDAHGDGLRDRRLADAGLADEHGIVLRAP